MIALRHNRRLEFRVRPGEFALDDIDRDFDAQAALAYFQARGLSLGLIGEAIGVRRSRVKDWNRKQRKARPKGSELESLRRMYRAALQLELENA
jgi:hypothetical protein